MAGQLRGPEVVIEDQAEASQTYNKGYYGVPQAGGSLKMDIMEVLEGTALENANIIPVSARTDAALGRRIEELRADVDGRTAPDAADVAHTLQRGRRAFAHRACFLAEGDRVSPHTLDARPLASGVAQLKFDSGTDVVMQAPCELTVVAADAARLLKGTVVVQVTELSDGFTLRTPDATILDEGTEYAVSLDTEATEVHVFDGSVLWEPAVGAGEKTVERIPAGEARRYLRSDPTKGARIPLRMVRFVRRIEADLREKAGAGLLAYDGFENLAGRIQRGRSGWGWSDGWKAGYHGHGQIGTIVDSPDDTVFGQSRGGRRLLRLAGGETMRRDLEHPLPLDPGSVYYVSFLVERPQRETEPGRFLEVSLYSEDEHPRRRAQGEIGFGVTSDGFPYLKNGGKIVQSAPAIESGIVYLLVAKVAVSTDRAVETYLRVHRDGEPVGQHEPSAWSAVGRPARCDFTPSRIRLVTGDKAAFDVDELRIGTTWRSVTSPATATGSVDVE